MSWKKAELRGNVQGRAGILSENTGTKGDESTLRGEGVENRCFERKEKHFLSAEGGRSSGLSPDV